jgi:hypothetical protein
VDTNLSGFRVIQVCSFISSLDNLGSQIDLALLAIRLCRKCGKEICFASGFK